MNRRSSLKKHRQDRVKEEILEASRSVLLSEGFAGLTLAAVARELELTKAAPCASGDSTARRVMKQFVQYS